MVARRPPTSRPRRVRTWDVLARDLVRGGTDWTVHSAFQRAFNLLATDGALLGVVAEPVGNGPATLVLEAADTVPAFNVLLTPGDAARRSGVRLAVGDLLEFDLEQVMLWQPVPIRRILPAPRIEARLARVAQIAASTAPAAGLTPLLLEARSLAADSNVPPVPPPGPGPSSESGLVAALARMHLRHLAAAVRDRRWAAILPPARELSGLGPGLTPAGDDALVGLALGLRTGLGSLPLALQSALFAAVEGRTTDLAVARVRHAVAGRADEAVHRLLGSLVAGDGEHLDEAVRTALDYGHSSGADTLVGLIVGLSLTLHNDGRDD